jgi:hypothetical protein
VKRLIACLGVLLLAVSASPVRSQGSLALGVSGGSFTVDGKAQFLVFVSYFDGLDVSDASLAADFAWLKSKKVDGVRVFPNWWNRSATANRYSESPLIKEDGALDAGRLAKLRRLLTIARTHGLVVDLSISAENVRKCSGAACATKTPFVPEGTLTKDELRKGLEALAADLLRHGFAHVLIDIQNEADYNTLFVDSSSRATMKKADIKTIADAIHTVNPKQLVTASISGGTSVTDAAATTTTAGLDITAWHETRDAEWWKSTAARVTALRGAGKPVYLQEPMPSNEAGWTVDGAAASLKAAIASGAAAWTFHTRASFTLNSTSLKATVGSAKSSNDRDFLNRLPGLIDQK